MNIPQVAQPTATGQIGYTMLFYASGKKEELQGKVYLFPGYEDYRFILVKPRGSVAKHNKSYWEVYETDTGYKIAQTLTKESTAQDALNMALNCLEAHSKKQWKEKINNLRVRIDNLKQST